MNLNCLNKTAKNMIKRLNEQIALLETSNMRNVEYSVNV